MTDKSDQSVARDERDDAFEARVIRMPRGAGKTDWDVLASAQRGEGSISPLNDAGLFMKTKKVSMSSVGYVDESPHDDEECRGCGMFRPDDDACTLVDGEINPGGWCRRWEKKS